MTRISNLLIVAVFTSVSYGISPVSYDIDAAGRAGLLGDIYDRVREKFTGSSTFKDIVNSSGIILVHGASPAVTTFKIINEHSERTSLLGLSTSLQTSSYLGLIDLKGSAALTRKFSFRQNCINGLLLYKYTKGSHRLNVRSPYVKSLFVPSAASDVQGTHIVTEVEYGMTISIGFHFEASTSEDVKALEASLTADMNSMVHNINTDKAWSGESRSRLDRLTFTAQVFGDSELGLSFVGNNITEIYATLKQVPVLLTNKLGSPIRYKLYTREKFHQIMTGTAISSTNGLSLPALRAIQRVEETVLSLFYEHDKNTDFYNEEMSRMIKYDHVLPDHYKSSAQWMFVRYTNAFNRRHTSFTNLVVSARGNFRWRYETRALAMASNFRSAKYGPENFNSFLTQLSTNVTMKLQDFQLLTSSGFQYIKKNSTTSVTALSNIDSSPFILFVNQSSRATKALRHEDCMSSGILVPGPKFVADCDILSLDQNCANYDPPSLLLFRNGVASKDDHCFNRTSDNSAKGTWLTRQLSAILFKFPHQQR